MRENSNFKKGCIMGKCQIQRYSALLRGVLLFCFCIDVRRERDGY